MGIGDEDPLDRLGHELTQQREDSNDEFSACVLGLVTGGTLMPDGVIVAHLENWFRLPDGRVAQVQLGIDADTTDNAMTYDELEATVTEGGLPASGVEYNYTVNLYPSENSEPTETQFYELDWDNIWDSSDDSESAVEINSILTGLEVQSAIAEEDPLAVRSAVREQMRAEYAFHQAIADRSAAHDGFNPGLSEEERTHVTTLRRYIQHISGALTAEVIAERLILASGLEQEALPLAASLYVHDANPSEQRDFVSGPRCGFRVSYCIPIRGDVDRTRLLLAIKFADIDFDGWPFTGVNQQVYEVEFQDDPDETPQAKVTRVLSEREKEIEQALQSLDPDVRSEAWLRVNTGELEGDGVSSRSSLADLIELEHTLQRAFGDILS